MCINLHEHVVSLLVIYMYISFNIIVSGTSKEKGGKENIPKVKHVSVRVVFMICTLSLQLFNIMYMY